MCNKLQRFFLKMNTLKSCKILKQLTTYFKKTTTDVYVRKSGEKADLPIYKQTTLKFQEKNCYCSRNQEWLKCM